MKKLLSALLLGAVLLAFSPVHAAADPPKKKKKLNPACSIVLDLQKQGVPIPSHVVGLLCKKVIKS